MFAMPSPKLSSPNSEPAFRIAWQEAAAQLVINCRICVHLCPSVVFLLAWMFAAGACSAEPFTLTDDFVAYLKTATNPHEFGLKADGRFHPYSTARGRRIGYDRPVLDKALYSRGCTKAEAEAQLRADAGKALADLTVYLARAHPAPAFSALSRKSQEMLVDFALSEGATNIPPALCDAVMKEDWNRLFNDFIYIRWVEKGWPDTARNKAFADRWLTPKSRLRPGPTVAPTDK
jgi:hypothetical protein